MLCVVEQKLKREREEKKFEGFDKYFSMKVNRIDRCHVFISCIIRSRYRFSEIHLVSYILTLGTWFSLCSALRVLAASKLKGERKKGRRQRHAWPKGWTDRGGKWVFHHPSAFSSFSTRHVSAHALFRVNATQWYTQGDTKILRTSFVYSKKK